MYLLEHQVLVVGGGEPVEGSGEPLRDMDGGRVQGPPATPRPLTENNIVRINVSENYATTLTLPPMPLRQVMRQNCKDML